MSTPRVSVIRATFNRAETLRFAIESVQRSTSSDWEMIVIHEMQSVAAGYGHLTELWRRDWGLDALSIDPAHQYVSPDHDRLPVDSAEIPYRFER